jgi:hypothetical protein
MFFWAEARTEVFVTISNDAMQKKDDGALIEEIAMQEGYWEEKG